MTCPALGFNACVRRLPCTILLSNAVHHCLYSPFRIHLSISMMLQFPKTNLTLSPRHSTISIKWRCRYYNPAKSFMYKIRRLLSGAPSAPFFRSGRTSYLMMSLLLTVLFFGPDVFPAQHLLSISLNSTPDVFTHYLTTNNRKNEGKALCIMEMLKTGPIYLQNILNSSLFCYCC